MKGSWNPMSIIPITLSLLLLLFMYNFDDVFAAPTRNLCRPEHRDALLEFKKEIEIVPPNPGAPHSYTDSWANNSDCCDWEGITCNAKSGEVIELDLSYNGVHGSISGLGKLHFLTTLKLSNNDFYGPIPSSIQKLSQLTSLELFYNKLSGEIPSSFGDLSQLTSLDLSFNKLSGEIPSSFGNLSQLASLDLSHNHFWGQIPSSIGNLHKLTSLHISDNNFTGEVPSSIGELYKLTSLDLQVNDFNGEIPSSVGNLSQLTSLKLSDNNFTGEIPSSFGNLNQLTSFAVDSNKLSGKLPIALLNLQKLSSLSLGNNQFTGTLPFNFTSLSNLMSFDANDNAFTGALPSSLFTIPCLDTIHLQNNQFNGTLEFGNISSPSKLRWLYLGNNNLRGPIPSSISKLTNLELLDLSHFTTTIDLHAILSYNLTRLLNLDLSGTHVLATNKSSVSYPPSQSMVNLFLSGCGITDFPDILRTLQDMTVLDISNNKIKGQVPAWLWTLPYLYYVNLSNNTLTGFENPTKLGLYSVSYMLGSNNNFTGKIPSFMCSLHFLITLDISNNNFNGSIPPCMGNLNYTLSVLNLRHNRLDGSLPENIFKRLRSLDVGHNQLVGKLPRSLIHFSTLEVLNVESNIINDTFPIWLSSLPELKVLVLRSNAFHGPMHQASFPKLKIIDISHNHFNGTLPSNYFVKWSAMSSFGTDEDTDKYMGDGPSGYYNDSMVLVNKGVEMELVRILNIYTALDFSGNKFEGEIPKSIGLLKELHVLTLSNNAFTGSIPSSIGNLTALESLDVSQNKLSGAIPQELGSLSLSFLAYMNFSHNHLAGPVPGGAQFQTQKCSSFEDNLGLVGLSRIIDCRDIHTPASPQPQESEEEDDEEVVSWIAAAIGFTPGIVLGLTIGYILSCYRPHWFMNPFGRRNRSIRTYLRGLFEPA